MTISLAASQTASSVQNVDFHTLPSSSSSGESFNSSDWAGLHRDLLDLVLNKLANLSDYLRFSFVCKQWFLVAQGKIKQQCMINTSCPPLPLLLVPIKESTQERCLYNVAQDNVLDFKLQVPYGERCCGSSHGWLITFDKTLTITLLNPFSNKTIKLPPFEFIKLFPPVEIEDFDTLEFDDLMPSQCIDAFITKAILSADPVLSRAYDVAVIYGGMKKLALYKSSEGSWTYFSDHPEVSYFKDLIYFKGNLHAIDGWMGIGKIAATNSSSATSPKVSLVARRALPKSPTKPVVSNTYLVEASDGDLLLVQRIFYEWLEYEEDDFDDYEGIEYDEDDIVDDASFTTKFRIFKLAESENKESSEAVEITDIGDNAIFLGDNYSTLVSTRHFPAGVKRNCIYYANDDFDPYFKPLDAGIFDLGDGSMKSHYIPENTKDKLHADCIFCKKRQPPLIWILPILVGNLA